MSRKEAFLIACRALAVMQGVSALQEATYLPMRLISLKHYSLANSMWIPTGGDSYLANEYRADVGFLILRIAIYLLLGVLFWNGGPLCARILLPADQSGAQSREPDSGPGQP